MLLGFFEQLRRYRVPVSLREFIDLLSLMNHRLVFADQNVFYFHSRLALVKDEKFYDRFDRAFAAYFGAVDDWQDIFEPDDSVLMESLLNSVEPKDRKALEQALEQYREELNAKRELAQKESDDSEPGDGDGNEGDSSAEGDSGESGEEGGEGEEGERGEEGESGDEGDGDDGSKGKGISEDGEEGEREQETEENIQKATKVWLDREFKDYDPDVELGTRNLKMSLRRLRRWVREASDLELDLDDTIRSTAANGGLLDIKEKPERHNAVRVLMLFDVGGSMDEHIELCAQLFSAVGSEFKYLEYYYFHNLLYETVWSENDRRTEDRLPVWQLLQKYPRDYKVIFVGDADMARHEIADRGGSVEHFNAEPGEVWMQRVLEQFRSVAWINPVPESRWQDSQSIKMVKRIVDDKMYFLSDTGLESAMKHLMR